MNFAFRCSGVRVNSAYNRLNWLPPPRPTYYKYEIHYAVVVTTPGRDEQKRDSRTRLPPGRAGKILPDDSLARTSRKETPAPRRAGKKWSHRARPPLPPASNRWGLSRTRMLAPLVGLSPMARWPVLLFIPKQRQNTSGAGAPWGTLCPRDHRARECIYIR